MGQFRGPQIVTDGLVFALDAGTPRGYSGTGSTLLDIKGSSNATMTNGAAYSATAGGVVDFPATNDYAIFNTPFTVTSSYTLLLWAKHNGLSAGGSGSGKPTGVNRETPLKGAGAWNPGIWVTSDYIRSHADTQYVDSSISWATSSWALIGMTYDGTDVKNIFNGVVLPNAHTTSYAPSNPTTVYLGVESTAGSSYSWSDKIGTVLGYDTVLTDDQIMENYNAHKSRYTNE